MKEWKTHIQFYPYGSFIHLMKCTLYENMMRIRAGIKVKKERR
jgi:hypothetical protein